MRLSQPVLDRLHAAMKEQRTAGREPTPALCESIAAAAAEARERSIPPERLLVQLKLVAEQAGLPPMLGDEAANALREWIVSACVEAYFGKPSR
jgi:hypothetical protein